MEEKKKKNTKKKTTTVKETKTKETTANKKKKKTVKKATKPVEKKIEKKEEILEKTYIFSKDEKENLDEVVSELNKEKIVVDNNVVDRNVANRNIIIALLAAIVMIVCACTVYVARNGLEDKNNVKSDNTTVINGETYRNLEAKDLTSPDDVGSTFEDIDYSNIINIDIDKFEVKVAKKENMLVLISSQTCYYCITFEPILNEVLSENNNKVLRLNISKMSSAEKERLRNYYAFKSAPVLLVIKDGTVVKDLTEALTKPEFTKWYNENIG